MIDLSDYKNKMAAPALDFVSINVGVKAQDNDNKFLSNVLLHLSNIAGQKAVLVKSNKAISAFKLREGMVVGCRVTLRRNKMDNFVTKLVNIALPRVKDFRGIASSGFNQSFHYSFGIKDCSIFPEVYLEPGKERSFGMNINIAIKAKNKGESLSLLKQLNFPIK